MEMKNFLTEEDERNLSPEQQLVYREFFNSVLQDGKIYKHQLEEYDKILRQQYEKGILSNPNSLDRYPEILSANLNKIIDEITEKRNNFIENGFDSRKLSDINSGLDILKEFVNRKNQVNRGKGDLEKLLGRIDQLQKQISQDIKYYTSYSQEKNKAYTDYKLKKEQYDNLSLFGKIAARVNGKKNELESARHNYTTRFGYSNANNLRKEGQIFNPTPYEDYLKKQEIEKSTGGRTR